MENKHTQSGLSTADFCKSIDGKETALYILTNKQGAELVITNYGAKIVSIMVPDRQGKMTDVVTGHKSMIISPPKSPISEPSAVGMETGSPKVRSHWTVLSMTNWPSTTVRTACMAVSKVSTRSYGMPSRQMNSLSS